MKNLAARLAVVALAAASCDLVLDIGSLDTNPVQVLAEDQCNPGTIALADGFIYWTTVIGGPSDAGCDTPSANTIRRLWLEDAGAPTDVVTADLDGVGRGGRPWSIAVVDGGVYWLGGCGTVCSASLSDLPTGCTPLSGAPTACAGIQAMAALGSSLYFAGGCGDTCDGGPAVTDGSIEAYDTAGGSSSAIPHLDHTKPTLSAMSVGAGSSPGKPQIAWIEGPPPTPCASFGYHLQVARPGDTVVWDSCNGPPSEPVFVATDGQKPYWLAQMVNTDSTNFELLTIAADESVTALVTDIVTPFSVAVDETNVYFTASNGQGSVYYVPKSQSPSVSIDAMIPIAAGRFGDAGSGLWGVAVDATWVYWLVGSTHGTVERALKPKP